MARIKVWKKSGRVGYKPLPTQEDSPAKYGIFYDSDTDTELELEFVKILKRKKKGASILKRKRLPQPEEADNAVVTTPNCYPSRKKTKIGKKVRWSEWAQVSSPNRPYEKEKDDPGVKFIHSDLEQQDDSEAENDAEEQESSPEPIEDSD